MNSDKFNRSAIFLGSLIGGLALWEIAGRYSSPAFLVPFSETVTRLSELIVEGQLWVQFLDSATVFAAGFALALGRALAHRIPGLNRESASAAYERAIAVICSKVNERGDFVGVSQQTPPGDFAFYNSIKVGTAPFGAGICMMALSEKIRRSR